MDTIAIFNNRRDALALATFLKKNSIAYSIINTPKKYVKNCALSVIFNRYYIPLVKKNFPSTLIAPY